MRNGTVLDTSPKINHFTWPDDDDESLCGQDVSKARWIEDSEHVDCDSCLDVTKLLMSIEDYHERRNMSLRFAVFQTFMERLYVNA